MIEVATAPVVRKKLRLDEMNVFILIPRFTGNNNGKVTSYIFKCCWPHGHCFYFRTNGTQAVAHCRSGVAGLQETGGGEIAGGTSGDVGRSAKNVRLALETYILHHKNRNSIWPDRGRNLIPPTATAITLQRDLLDHSATYTVAEKDVNAFLDDRFALNGGVLDSLSKRGRPGPKDIGNAIGQPGWVVTKDTVVYHYSAGNGGGHTYYHDPTTGRSYQISAYW